MGLPMREDEVTDGNCRDEILANAPRGGARLLRRAQGGGVTGRSPISPSPRRATGLRAKKFSAREMTEAHIAAMTAARPLNAFLTETPERALAMAAASDARIARGEALPLDGMPLAIKDLFCTEGVLHHRRLAHSRRLHAAL